MMLTQSPPLLGLVATKFQPPKLPQLIERHHLLTRLDHVLEHRLTLITAPAGAGKTTLVQAWLRHRQPAWAWYALDEADDHPLVFLQGLIYSLQACLGQGNSLALLQQGERQAEVLFSALIHDCLAQTQPLVLVLDDYHDLNHSEIHNWLKRLLDYAPPQLHLVITSRQTLPFSISRLRSQGQVLVLQLSDLAFRHEEIDRLAQLHRVQLDSGTIQTLQQITEGWAVGLRLMLMLNQADHRMTSENRPRLIFEYLSEQVFDQLDSDMQRFLLISASCKRFCAPLLQALLPQQDCNAMLSRLERENLFLMSLDEQGIWYRYHHLFRDFLLRTLNKQPAQQIMFIYQQAALWFEAHELLQEAVDYALLAGDEPLVLAFISKHGRRLCWQQSAWGQLERWMEALSPSAARNPHIAILRASIAAQNWHFDECRRYLDIAASLLDETIDHEEAAMLRTELEALEFMFPAPRSMQSADLPPMIARMEALNLQHWDVLQSVVLMRAADMSYMVGEFAQARDLYWRAIRTVTNQPNATVVLSSFATLARLARDDGDWDGALVLCQEAQEYAARWQASETDESRHISLFMSILYYDVADFASAERLAQVALQMNGMPYRINSYIQLARTLAMQGRSEDALQSLYYAADLAKRHHITPMQPTVARTIAWVAMRQQDEQAVRHWLQSVEALLQEQISRPRPSAPEEVSLLAGAEGYLLVGEAQRSLALLNPLEATIRARGRKLPLARLKALQAAACFALGEIASSLAALDEVLAILSPTRFISTAADIGAPLLEVLLRYAADRGESAALKRLIACAQLPLHKLPNPQQVLSYRELEVLRLVAIGDSNQEIAARLYISESTVKTHLKRIFAKLKAASRTQAVAQARALNLI